MLLAALPLSHAFGINGALFAPLLAGTTVALVERFVPETVAALLQRLGVTVLPGVATMFRRLLDLPGFAGGHAGCVSASRARRPARGSSPQDWRARTGVRIVRGYGMTELFRPLSYLVRRSDGPRRSAWAAPVPGVEIRVVDDDGRALPPGETGELLIRTPAAMDGYLDSPEDTGAVFDDGWFRTGDLARVTDDGYVSIVGRQRERIKRGGYSVFPAEVEAVVLAHPAVAEAAAVGMPRPDAGRGDRGVRHAAARRRDRRRRADRLVPRAPGRLQVPATRCHRPRAAEERDRQDPTRPPALSTAREGNFQPTPQLSVRRAPPFAIRRVIPQAPRRTSASLHVGPSRGRAHGWHSRRRTTREAKAGWPRSAATRFLAPTAG